MSNKKYVVYLGCPGFPYGLAEIQKVILISKSLILTGNNVTIIGNKGLHRKKDHPDLRASGTYENIEYVYTSGDPFRSESFLGRNISKIKGAINEFLFIKNRKNDDKLDYAILSTKKIRTVLYCYILSKLFGFKTILNYVEYFSDVKRKWYQIGKSLNDKLYDRYAPLLVDAVFPISEFLINHLEKVSPAVEYLKIPGLTEFERYDNIQESAEQKYFLFCGAAYYNEIIEFIIDAYCKLEHTSALLYLVVNGSQENIDKVKNYAAKTPQKDNIKFFSRLSEKQLFTYYKNAIALLIPLRPTFQDIARFPHKFGEYLASGNPVVTTNYGEVRKYFRDMDNMLVAEKYEIDLFADRMQFVIDNPDLVKKIGEEGKKTASPIFDYRIKAAEIDNFLDTLNHKQKRILQV